VSTNKKLSCRWQTARRICANGWPPKSTLLLVCYHAKFGSSALKDVGINTGEPHKLGSAGTLLSWVGRRGKPFLYMCCHVKFGSSASKGVCIYRWEPPKLGPMGHHPFVIGAWLTPRNTLLHSMLSCRIWSFYRSNGTNVIKEIRLKIWPLVSCLSRSLKVIGTDRSIRHGATHDFLLTLHSNACLIRFRDKRRFFPPMYLMPPLKGFVPLGIEYR